MGEISFKNVTKDFTAPAKGRRTRALDKLSFTVNDGEFLTLLGPSGCGKTTTLNLIAGILNPSEGEIYINQKLVNDIPVHKRNIGMVFQSYALFPHMNVFDNVAFGLRMKKRPRREIPALVAGALRLVNMEGFGERKPAELSGGQQQRIALARALVFDPDVLLLDEPLSNLDAKLRESVRFEILQLHAKTKKTIVFVTHDQIEALTMSDRIILMNQGRVEQTASPVELYSNPATAFAAGFIGSGSFIDCKVIDCSGSMITAAFNGITVSACAPPGPALAPGADAVLAVRPENVRLLNRDNTETFLNVLEGRLVNTVFQGADTLLYLDINGALLKAVAANQTNVRPGDTVTVGFDEARVFGKQGIDNICT